MCFKSKQTEIPKLLWSLKIMIKEIKFELIWIKLVVMIIVPRRFFKQVKIQAFRYKTIEYRLCPFSIFLIVTDFLCGKEVNELIHKTKILTEAILCYVTLNRSTLQHYIDHKTSKDCFNVYTGMLQNFKKKVALLHKWQQITYLEH